MRPSQYNYLKRAFTRNMAKRNSFLVWNILFFPFRLCLIIVVYAIYVEILVLYYATKIIFKLLKFIFKFLKNFFVGLFMFIKEFYKKNYYKTPKEKKEEAILKYIKSREEINIPDIMKEFDISSSEAIRITTKTK